MRRFEMTDEQFHRIEHLLPGKPGDPGVTAKDNRLFVDAVLWVGRTGAPWPDLPERFGRYDTAYQRFNRWAKRGVWARVMEALGADADLEWLLIDSTIVRAHQHAAGAEKKGATTIRPWVARAAASAPRSTSRSTAWATRRG
jgi:transposase